MTDIQLLVLYGVGIASGVFLFLKSCEFATNVIAWLRRRHRERLR